MTRFINAFDDARGRRCDDDEGRARTDRLWRRAAEDCTAVSDRALPRLVEAIRATITRPNSGNAVMQLINAASDAVKVYESLPPTQRNVARGYCFQQCPFATLSVCLSTR